MWEVTGFEFTESKAHTAAGISIRFPRLARERTDKGPREATSLKELEALKKASGGTIDAAASSSAGGGGASSAQSAGGVGVHVAGFGKQFRKNLTEKASKEAEDEAERVARGENVYGTDAAGGDASTGAASASLQGMDITRFFKPQPPASSSASSAAAPSATDTSSES